MSHPHTTEAPSAVPVEDDWATWDETRPHLNVDEAAVAAADAEMAAAEVAYRLAELRRSQGRTQAEVAAAMGVSQNRVSQLERGDLARTELSTVQRYVEAIGGHVRMVADFPGQTVTVR